MARDTLLGFPAHTLPYRCGKFITLSTASAGEHALLLSSFQFPIMAVPAQKESPGRHQKQDARRGLFVSAQLSYR